MSNDLLRIAFIGDIYGSPGRRVLRQQLPRLRDEHQPHLIIANAENARSGSGLSPKLYRQIRDLGIDAVTLGDHVFRDQRIAEILQQPAEPIARPANLSAKAVGRPFARIPCPVPAVTDSVYVIPVLGRIFMNMPADDPFAAVDRILQSLPEQPGGPPAGRPIVLVEAHMEATSEKAALAHHLDGRVSAVIGTHTHVPTADARILSGGTAFITDVGMCGPYRSIIGAAIDPVVRAMTTSMHVPYAVGEGEEALCGALLEIQPGTGRAITIRPLRYEADRSKEPFV